MEFTQAPDTNRSAGLEMKNEEIGAFLFEIQNPTFKNENLPVGCLRRFVGMGCGAKLPEEKNPLSVWL